MDGNDAFDRPENRQVTKVHSLATTSDSEGVRQAQFAVIRTDKLYLESLISKVETVIL